MDFNSLLTPATGLGPAEWVFFIASILVALGGAYLAFFRSDQLVVRAQALQRLGYALLASGVAGTLIGGLRLGGVALAPIWFTIITVLYVIIVIIALYYAMSVYPGQLAAAQASARGRGSRPSAARGQSPRLATPSTPSAPVDTTPRPPPSGRRDSRRDRKRRKK
jgi:hypothetical protein